MPSFLTLPRYDPLPYSFAGLEFCELPDEAKEYLSRDLEITENNLWVPTNLFRRKREIEEELRGAISKSNTALIELKREVTKTGENLSWVELKKIVEADNKRVEKVLEELLPKRLKALYRFTMKMDTLIWLEYNAPISGCQLSAKEQQRHRDRRLSRVLQETQKPVQYLDVKDPGRMAVHGVRNRVHLRQEGGSWSFSKSR